MLHAVGHLMKQRNGEARVAYVHSERFVSDMVRALQHNTMNDFKAAYRSLDALLIDDIEINCTAARDLGMHAVWFRDTDQAIAETEEQLR